MQKGIQLRASLARRDQLFPPFVILPGQQESGEIGDLSTFALGQCFTYADQFLGLRAHACNSNTTEDCYPVEINSEGKRKNCPVN